MVLVYTNRLGPQVSACASEDMISWQERPHLLTVPSGKAYESPSVHPLRNGYVLWFNDYAERWCPCRAAYAFSGDRFHFEPGAIKAFGFETDHPDATPSPECETTTPFPLSIELIATGETSWLVSYFRWHMDRNRLFFGEIDWSREPAVIREIIDPVELEKKVRFYQLAD